MPDPTAPDLAELRRLEAAATPGPWGWRGNDDGLVELRGHGPFGAYDGRVISAHPAEPCTATRADGEVALTAEACDVCKAKWAEMLEQGHTDMWDGYRCPKPENLATVWLTGAAGIEPANRWAKREQPYRTDVADVDHPDARLIAVMRNALPWLLDQLAPQPGTAERVEAALQHVYVVMGDRAPSDIDIKAGTADAPWWLDLRDAVDGLADEVRRYTERAPTGHSDPCSPTPPAGGGVVVPETMTEARRGGLAVLLSAHRAGTHAWRSNTTTAPWEARARAGAGRALHVYRGISDWLEGQGLAERGDHQSLRLTPRGLELAEHLEAASAP